MHHMQKLKTEIDYFKFNCMSDGDLTEGTTE